MDLTFNVDNNRGWFLWSLLIQIKNIKNM
jgi:hypothetical protein